MNQSQVNQKWLNSGGGITFLDPPKIKSGRYQYTLSFSDSIKLKAELKQFFSTLKEGINCSCNLLEIKPLSKGFRLNWFILSHNFGRINNSSSGISQLDWDEINNELNRILSKYFNPVYIYHENWHCMDKFQNRFETYVEVI